MIIMSLDDRSGRIKHDSATPVPVQVAADIERDIDAGRLASDTRLPSEMELSAQYGVARVSVRRAMELLRERRKVVTVHGRGTFVAPQPERLPFRAAYARRISRSASSGPGIIGYRGSSDCRILVVSHKLIMIAAAGFTRSRI
jgi:DNA-binding transcriptional regulator YhcF (GntR family)